jgi:hypothetical protein
MPGQSRKDKHRLAKLKERILKITIFLIKLTVFAGSILLAEYLWIKMRGGGL